MPIPKLQLTMPALNFSSLKILGRDKLQSGFRTKYNLLVDKVIKNAIPTKEGLKLITHDDTELEIDLTEFFYNKDTIDELFFISYATEEDSGTIRIGTMEEVLEGEDDLTAVTPYKLATLLSYFHGRALIAGEDLEYGDFVYLLPTFEYADPDDPDSTRTLVSLVVKKAISTSQKTLCDGYIEEGGEEGEEVFVRFSGSINTGLTGLIPHAHYYLSYFAPGTISIHRPGDEGTYSQVVGYAISETELMLKIERAEGVYESIFSEPLPELLFTVGKESKQSIQLDDYFSLFAADQNFSYKFIGLPEWISEHTVVFDNMSITGNPIEEGKWVASLQVTDQLGKKTLEDIVLRALPATLITASLIDSASGQTIGDLPGGYTKPAKFNASIDIEGPHDRVDISLKGGGVDGNSVTYTRSIALEEVQQGSYMVDDPIVGFTGQVGVFELKVSTFRKDEPEAVEVFNFVLFDEAYLNKAKFEFWDLAKNIKLGDINPDGSSSFFKPDFFDIKVIVDNVIHTKATLSASMEAQVVQSRVIDVSPAKEDAEYWLYNQVKKPQESGFYDFSLKLNNLVPTAYLRLIQFTVMKAQVKPEGGLVLIDVIPHTSNYIKVGELPIKGAELDLPNNWGVLSEYSGEPVDHVSWKHYTRSGAGYVEYDSSLYTGLPQEISYIKPKSEDKVLVFRNKGSLDIGQLHRAPIQQKFVVTYRIGGPAGEVVSIQTSEFGLRIPIPASGYSGLRFLNVSGTTISVIDENVPKVGRQYEYPESGVWSVSDLSFSGKQFNRVKVGLEKFVAGQWILLHWQAADSIYTHISPTTVTKLASDDLAYIIGLQSTNGRFLYGPANQEILIDEVGRYRATFTGYLNTTLVEVKSADFELIEPAGDLPITDCCSTSSGGGSDIEPGNAMSSRIVGEIRKFDTRVDNISLEIVNPDNPAQNYIRVKLKSITLTNLQDIPAKSLLGNLGSLSGAVATIGIVDTIGAGSPSAVASTSAIVSYVKGVVDQSLTGTAGRIPKYNTPSGLVDSIMRESAGTVYTEGGAMIGAAAADKVLISSSAGASILSFRDTAGSTSRYQIESNSTRLSFTAGGVEVMRLNSASQDATFIKPVRITSAAAPLIVTSQSLVINFNADLFEGRHGDYYLSRDNHTGFQLASTISDFGSATRGTLLDGLTSSTGSAITPTDSILSAFGKLQAQVNSIGAAGGVSGTAGRIVKYATNNTLGNSLLSESGSDVTVNGGLIIKRGVSANSQTYLELSPTDYSAGKHRMTFFRSSAGDSFQISVSDPTITGKLDFSTAVLTHNGLPIATQSWANSVFALISHVHAAATTSAAGFMSAADKVKLDSLSGGGLTGSGTVGQLAKWSGPGSLANSLITDTGVGVVVGGFLTVSRPLSSASQTYFELRPTNYGTGVHRMHFYRWTSGDAYSIIIEDGTDNGKLDIVSSVLTHNGQPLATQSWADSRFALTNHTHGLVTASLPGFMSSADKVKLDGLTAGAYVSGTGVAGQLARWANSTTLASSVIEDTGVGVIVGGFLSVTRPAVAASQTYFQILPPDFGPGVHQLRIYRWISGDAYSLFIDDGTNNGTNNGKLDFVTSILTHKGQPLATQVWSNSTFSLNNHTHANATTSVSGFMSATDKTKLDGLISGANLSGAGTAGQVAKWTGPNALGSSLIEDTGVGVIVNGFLTASRPAVAASQTYFQLLPPDFGTGVHQFRVYRWIAGDAYSIIVDDGTSNGKLDFVTSVLTHNGQPIATQAWANSRFSLLTHTHANATTTVSGFMSAADKVKLDGLANSDLTGTGTSGFLTKWISGTGLANSVISEVSAAVSVAGSVTINRGVSALNQTYLELRPTDYSAGKHRFYIYRTSVGNMFQFIVSDPTVSGNIDFVVSGLTHNGLPLATQSWASNQFAVISHIHANATSAAAGFMSAADKVKLDALSSSGGITGTGTVGVVPKWISATGLANSIITDLGTSVSIGGALTVSRPATTTSQSYLELKPANFGAGIHRMYFYRLGVGNAYSIIVDDGVTPGKLDVATSAFTYNGQQIATQSWATSTFALISHSHANATTSAPGFMSAADKVKLDGLSNSSSSLSGSGTAGFLAKFTAPGVIGNSIISDTGSTAVVSGHLAVVRGVSSLALPYLELKPSDYGVGKHRFYLYRPSAGNSFQFIVDDTSTYGQIDFIVTNLAWRGDVLATRTWAAGQYAPISHVHTQYALTSHTHSSSQIVDFTQAVRTKIQGGNSISYDSNTGIINFTGSAGGGTTISGGTKMRLAKFNVEGNNILDSRIHDPGAGQMVVFADLGVDGILNAYGGFIFPHGALEQRPLVGTKPGETYYVEGNPGAVYVWTLGNEWKRIAWFAL